MDCVVGTRGQKAGQFFCFIRKTPLNGSCLFGFLLVFFKGARNDYELGNYG